jgi:hypothetical protein
LALTAINVHHNNVIRTVQTFEHGHGVKQTLEMAAQYYKSSAGGGHPEAKLNYIETKEANSIGNDVILLRRLFRWFCLPCCSCAPLRGRECRVKVVRTTSTRTAAMGAIWSVLPQDHGAAFVQPAEAIQSDLARCSSHRLLYCMGLQGPATCSGARRW